MILKLKNYIMSGKFKGASKDQVEELSNEVKSVLNLDENTGVGIFLTRKKEQIPDFVMMFQRASSELLIKNAIGTAAYKILYLFGAKLSYSNHIGIDQKTIAEETNLSLPTVKRCVEELMEQHIIIKYQDPQDKRRNVYMVNPQIMWKGKNKERKKIIKSIDKNQLLIDLK